MIFKRYILASYALWCWSVLIWYKIWYFLVYNVYNQERWCRRLLIQSKEAEIIISQNILGQVKVEFQMDDLCWPRLKKSSAWKEVCQLLGVCQKQDIPQSCQGRALVKEIGCYKNPSQKHFRPIHAWLNRLKQDVFYKGKNCH